MAGRVKYKQIYGKHKFALKYDRDTSRNKGVDYLAGRVGYVFSAIPWRALLARRNLILFYLYLVNLRQAAFTPATTTSSD